MNQFDIPSAVVKFEEVPKKTMLVCSYCNKFHSPYQNLITRHEKSCKGKSHVKSSRIPSE